MDKAKAFARDWMRKHPEGLPIRKVMAQSYEEANLKMGDIVTFTDKDWKKYYPGKYEVGYVSSTGKIKLQDIKTKQRLPVTFNPTSVKKESFKEAAEQLMFIDEKTAKQAASFLKKQGMKLIQNLNRLTFDNHKDKEIAKRALMKQGMKGLSAQQFETKEKLDDFEFKSIKNGMSKVLKILGFNRMANDILKAKTQDEVKKYLAPIKQTIQGSRLPDDKKKRGWELIDKLGRKLQEGVKMERLNKLVERFQEALFAAGDRVTIQKGEHRGKTGTIKQVKQWFDKDNYYAIYDVEVDGGKTIRINDNNQYLKRA